LDTLALWRVFRGGVGVVGLGSELGEVEAAQPYICMSQREIIGSKTTFCGGHSGKQQGELAVRSSP